MINWNRGWKLFLRSASSGSSQIEPKTIELKRLQTQIRRLWKFRLPTTELQMFSTRKKLRVFFSKCPTSSKNEIFPFAHASLQLPRENNILPFCCPKILAPSAVNCVQRTKKVISNFLTSNFEVEIVPGNWLVFEKKLITEKEFIFQFMQLFNFYE